MIGWFSTGTFSADNTGAVFEPMVRWLLPGATDALVAALHALTRKSAHFTEYALLAALWFGALTRERGSTPRQAAWVAFFVAAAWACLDELHQGFVPSRTPSVADVALDSAGALTAALVGRYGGTHVLERAAAAFLWTVAAVGTLVIVVDLGRGASSGVLWLTVPAATLALALQRRGAEG